MLPGEAAGCGVSLLGALLKPPGHGPGQPAPGVPA